ncbi:hypothetical protein PRIPAC_87183 [Pristionchus pacificus]|uniref:valine--tRNA ligase n=1 Tax=Pristionchus pacificus TaxID=54126 RepID=A0A2A6CW52_PRIPA|nr:hypothetical protein PRIPAC_87183 [Pristionchus pacificus]|eukprot:PDM82389.1 hypothetical protein PRIPAC_36782 [Pristionchus pacificus]
MLFTDIVDPSKYKKARTCVSGEYPVLSYKNDIEMMGIQECGADALRFTLLLFGSLFGTLKKQKVVFDVLEAEKYRGFADKIWKAVRSTVKYLENFTLAHAFEEPLNASYISRWILSRLSTTVTDCNNTFATGNGLNFTQATTALHNFWDHDYGVFIESLTLEGASGSVADKEVLLTCTTEALCLLSPFMPFITEELWQRLPRRESETALSICVSPYPEVEKDELDKERLEASIAVFTEKKEKLEEQIRKIVNCQEQNSYVLKATPEVKSKNEDKKTRLQSELADATATIVVLNKLSLRAKIRSIALKATIAVKYTGAVYNGLGSVGIEVSVVLIVLYKEYSNTYQMRNVWVSGRGMRGDGLDSPKQIGIVVKRTTSRRPGRVDYEENVQDFEMKSSVFKVGIVVPAYSFLSKGVVLKLLSSAETRLA